MAKRLRIHFITLPRWFAFPAIVASVLLGSAIEGEINWLTGMAILAALCIMAASHSQNTLYDWYLTKLDRGEEEVRSHEKIYTSGQQLFAHGEITWWENVLNIMAWLVMGAIFVATIGVQTSPWVWLPYGLIVPMALWYSYAKLYYHPELPLGLGFGPFAVMLGASAVSADPDLWTAFLAGIPLAICFGWVAEAWDQYKDADANWDKGLRSLGAICWANSLHISILLIFEIVAMAMAQFAMIVLGILAPETMLSFIALVPVAFMLVWIKPMPRPLPAQRLYFSDDEKKGVIAGLVAVVLYCMGIAAGQIWAM
jgi:hypothetical protein